MGRTLIGFAAGVVLTSFAFFVLDIGTVEISSLEPVAGSVSGSETVADNRSLDASLIEDSESFDRIQEPATSINATGAPLELTGAQLRELTWQELEALREGPITALLHTRIVEETVRRQNNERWLNESPPDQPIILPPEFASLSVDVDPFHEKLQRERVDPDWSFVTESQIATFLAEHPQITQKYGQPIINCRETGCEVAFVAYGVEETALGIFNEGMFWSVNGESWADQFDNPAGYLFNVRRVGDATTILWHLWKKPE